MRACSASSSLRVSITGNRRREGTSLFLVLLSVVVAPLHSILSFLMTGKDGDSSFPPPSHVCVCSASPFASFISRFPIKR